MASRNALFSGLAVVGLAFWFGTQFVHAEVTIFVQPSSQTVLVGGNASFTATVATTAGETITSYTWLMSADGLSPFTTVGANAVHTISNAQTNHAGFYFVRVGYQSGTNAAVRTSAAVELIVNDQARIIEQPQGLIRLVGSDASFTVGAAGQSPLTYQWRRNGVNLTNGSRISGATTSSLTISGVVLADSGAYDAVVGNVHGTATSQEAQLEVLAPPSITAQPQNTVVILGSNATFNVASSGTAPLSFRWSKGTTSLSDGGKISGATSDSLTITGVSTGDAGNYRVTVTNAVGVVSSSNAMLTVLVPPTIISPGSATGRQGVLFGYSILAVGTPPMTYGAADLPAGLGIQPANGVISGVPEVAGVFDITLFATNAAGVNSKPLTLTLTTGVPGITSAPVATGRQGQFFSYTITASNDPVSFSASDLPPGLSLDAATGVISGVPAVDGSFPVPIEAVNAYGSDAGELAITLTTGVPGITSVLFVTGKQGQPFSYTITASNDPVSFNAVELPLGLSLDPETGIVSGLPLVNGLFPVMIEAVNDYGSDEKELAITLTTGVPGITSELFASGKQGQMFSYTITASNDPVSFSASDLPLGLSFDPATQVISGRVLASGTFPVTIEAANEYGADNPILWLDLATARPVITSPLTAAGGEDEEGFSYTITASNSPAEFGAEGLPLGLTIDTETGVISGKPLYGGEWPVLIWAVNDWGTGSDVLTLDLDYTPISELAITDVVYTWSSPYLLDFSFSLRDGFDPLTSLPLVRPASDLTIVAMENESDEEEFGIEIGAEAGFITSRADRKLLKVFLVLDYSFSMFIAPEAIDKMEEAAKLLIDELPPSAEFGIYEFHADFMDPNLVTGFTSDKKALHQEIEGIRDDHVQGQHAGTRAFDALYAALNQFSAPNPDEERYVVVMTDGIDESSVLNEDGDPIEILVDLANEKKVRIFAVAFGEPDPDALGELTSQTLGRYYQAESPDDLVEQYQRIIKEVDNRYALRWATLKRGNRPFQPSFRVTLGGFSDIFFVTETNIVIVIDDEVDPPEETEEEEIIRMVYNPQDWAGDVQVGRLRLSADADSGAQTIRLRAGYVPRFVREMRLRYRANYPGTVSLDSTGEGEILQDWTLAQEDDGEGGYWLTLTSPPPHALANSIPYAVFGNLITFQFQHPEHLTAQQAFSLFEVDNSIYTNLPPTGQSFIIENTNQFVTVYEPAPPYGTPIPWLIAHGMTSDFAEAELMDLNGNGLAVWQEYIAGLDPRDVDAFFFVEAAAGASPEERQIAFNTVIGRKYRVENAFSIDGPWLLLHENINGTGGIVSISDQRDLSGVDGVFYRVGVY